MFPFDQLVSQNMIAGTNADADSAGILLPIMISSDATTLANSPGDLKLHPFYVTLASIPRAQRNLSANEAIVMTALMPQMPGGTTTEIGREDYRNAKRQLFHDCLSALFEPVIKHSRHGMRMYRTQSRQYHVYPVLWSISADYQEMVTLMGVRAGWCTSCTIFQDDLHVSPEALDRERPALRTCALMRDLSARKKRDVKGEFIGTVPIKVHKSSLYRPADLGDCSQSAPP